MGEGSRLRCKARDLPGEPWFCVLEYLAGGSLQKWLDTEPVTQAQTLQIAYQLSSALDYLHAKGIAHLDLKPDNILFRSEWFGRYQPDAVLIDFGIARRVKQAHDGRAGTMSFLSPERVRQMLGEPLPDSLVDQRPSDVYALGLLLYRMLTGSLPFDDRSRDKVIDAILNDTPQPPSQLNPDIGSDLEEIILKSLQKDPQHGRR